MRKFILNPSLFFIVWFIFIFSGSISVYFTSITISFLLMNFLFIFSLFLGFLITTPKYNIPSLKIDFQKDKIDFFFWICLFSWTISQLTTILPIVKLMNFSNPSSTKDIVTDIFLSSEGESFNASGKGIGVIVNMCFYLLGFPSLTLGAIKLSKRQYVGLIPLLLGSLSSLVSFSRFQMFVYLGIFFYSYISYRIYFGNLMRFSKVFFRIIFIALVLFLLPAFLRSDGDDFNLVGIFLDYLFGGFAAFNKWFVLNNNSILWGDLAGRTFYTLKTWLFYLHLGAAPPSLHSEFIYISENVYTNVYSLFRPLLEDFGLLFSMVVLFFFSAFSNFCFRMMIHFRRKEYIPLCAFLWTSAFFLFYTSIFVDFRIFLGSILTFFIFKNILYINRRNI